MGLGRADAANSAPNTIPLDAYFIRCTKPIDATSHFIVRGGGGTLRVKEGRARKSRLLILCFIPSALGLS